MLGESPKGRERMSPAVEAREHIALILDERQPLKTALPRIARRLGITPRRVRALWNGEARRIEAAEINALRAAALQQQVSDAQQQANRLEALAARLEGSNASVFAADIDAARQQARRLRDLIAGGA